MSGYKKLEEGGPAAMGLPDGEHSLGEATVTVQGIRATLKSADGNSDTLAGFFFSRISSYFGFYRV